MSAKQTAKEKLAAVNPAEATIQRRKNQVRKISKEISQLHQQEEERRAAKLAALKELHTKQTENMPDGPEYFQMRYDQEQAYLQDAQGRMDHFKSGFELAKKDKRAAIERIINLRKEIEEAKSPILAMARRLDGEAWKTGEINLLESFGLAPSVVESLKEGGVNTIGQLFEADEAWRDFDGMGEATQQKVTDAAAGFIDNFNEQLKEVQKTVEAGE